MYVGRCLKVTDKQHHDLKELNMNINNIFWHNNGTVFTFDSILDFVHTVDHSCCLLILVTLKSFSLLSS